MNADISTGAFEINNSINWSEKVRLLDETIRKEIGLESEEIDAKHILIKVQTKSAECIEPAFIVGEDDTFLDLFVLSGPNGGGIISTAVLKTTFKVLVLLEGYLLKKWKARNHAVSHLYWMTLVVYTNKLSSNFLHLNQWR